MATPASRAATRRALLRGALSGAALVLAGQKPGLAGSSRYCTPIGFQAYSVREQLRSAPRETLRRLADAGYEEIELFDIESTGHAIAACREFGLKLVGLHFWELFADEGSWARWLAAGAPGPAPTTDVARLVAHADAHGFRHFVFSGDAPREAQVDPGAARHYCRALDELGRQLTDRGLRLLYHPHMAEFTAIGSTTLYDLLVESTSAQHLGFEIDVFWMTHVGRDPVREIEKLGGRVEMLHIKDRRKGEPLARPQDGSPEDKGIFVPVGTGSMDFPAILRAAQAAGVRHFFVEQDESTGDPVESLNQGYRYLRQLLSAPCAA